VLWYYFDSLLFLLFVPFVLFLLRGSGGGPDERRPEVTECPACGYRITDPAHDYCPRDGTRLERGRPRSSDRG
jgi:hypothetical protein